MTTINIDNLAKVFPLLVSEIASGLPDMMQRIGQNAVLLIKNRIQEKGEDADNKRLPPYSTTEVPPFFYWNKATNEGGRNIVRQRQKQKRGLSYRDFKAANNGAASVEVTNLTFTGEMFRGLKIVEQGDKGGEYLVRVGGSTTSSDDRIDWNSERYGDILRLSKEEEEVLAHVFDEELQRIIDEQ